MEANEETKHKHGRQRLSYIVQAIDKNNSFCFAPGPKGDQGSKGDNGQDGKAGVKYIRWGRTTCPNGAELVYKGQYRPMYRFAGLSIIGEF